MDSRAPPRRLYSHKFAHTPAAAQSSHETPTALIIGRFPVSIARRVMALAPGVRLGPYEIVSALGAGGMGEVYNRIYGNPASGK